MSTEDTEALDAEARAARGRAKKSVRAEPENAAAITIVCFALASMLYGAAVTGMSDLWTKWTALGFVVFSAYCSLIFELAVAKEHFAPRRPRRALEEGCEA